MSRRKKAAGLSLREKSEHLRAAARIGQPSLLRHTRFQPLVDHPSYHTVRDSSGKQLAQLRPVIQ